jgi:hypothetical protein
MSRQQGADEMRTRTITRPEDFSDIDQARKSYGTAERAIAAAEKVIGGWWHDATATIVPVQRRDGRFVPIVIYQGKDATQACIDTAHSGFTAFA